MTSIIILDMNSLTVSSRIITWGIFSFIITGIISLIIGIITGTYSSIYIASALVLWWHKGERPKLASQVALEDAVTARA